MVSILWTFLIVVSILYAILSGNVSIINTSVLSSGNKALELILSLLPMIVLWTGIMKIAEKAGLLQKFAHFLYPFLKFLFPSIPKNHESLGYISSNIAANILGLGSAATPFGLKAMKSLDTLNKEKNVASSSMITFLVLNTAGVTIIPTTIIALRASYNSLNPTAIIAPAIISTMTSCFSAVFLDYLVRRFKR